MWHWRGSEQRRGEQEARDSARTPDVAQVGTHGGLLFYRGCDMQAFHRPRLSGPRSYSRGEFPEATRSLLLDDSIDRGMPDIRIPQRHRPSEAPAPSPGAYGRGTLETGRARALRSTGAAAPGRRLHAGALPP